jgi:exopolysaccharide production protein ExoZ
VDGSKNEGLQVARAVAALSVAYFHSYIALRAFPESAQIPIGPLKDWGYLGVNLFFAISGYVICLVASKPTFSPASFAIKRVFRLFPMYWVAMATIAFMITIGKYRPEPLGHFLYSMTLLPQSGPSAYDVSWTLERELVFYALATVTVPFAGIPGLAIVLTTLAAAGWYFGNPWSYHLLSTIHADFLAGVVLFLFHDQAKRLGTIAPIAIGMALLAYTRSHDFVFSVPLCMGLILLGMINLRLPWHRWPLRWIVQAGDASYSIYLLHYIVYFWAAFTSARVPWSLPDWLCEPWRFVTLAMCCLISVMTWRHIERPMIRIGNQVAGATFGIRDRVSAAFTD